jgi:hypothetical protein
MTKPCRKGELPKNYGGKDLGHILNYFPTRNYKLKRWLMVIAGVFVILTAIGLIINRLLNLTTGIQTHGRAMILETFPFPIVIYAIILVGGIILVILSKLRWWDCITLFEAGLIKEKGNCVEVWFYEDTDCFDNYVINIIFGGSIVGGQVKILLEDGSKGSMIIRDNFIRMPDLVQTLRSRVLPGLIERARLQLDEGQVLHFNKKLSASAHGIEINHEVLPYKAIQAEIKNHTIELLQKENPRKLLYKSSVTKIRNMDLFLDLLDNPPNPTDQSSPR